METETRRKLLPLCFSLLLLLTTPTPSSSSPFLPSLPHPFTTFDAMLTPPFRYFVHQTLSDSPHDLIHNTDHMRHTFPMICHSYHKTKWVPFVSTPPSPPTISLLWQTFYIRDNCTLQDNNSAVAVSFQSMVGDIFQSIHAVNRKKTSVTECVNRLDKPIVILAFVDQNWGFLSSCLFSISLWGFDLLISPLCRCRYSE